MVIARFLIVMGVGLGLILPATPIVGQPRIAPPSTKPNAAVAMPSWLNGLNPNNPLFQFQRGVNDLGEGATAVHQLLAMDEIAESWHTTLSQVRSNQFGNSRRTQSLTSSRSASTLSWVRRGGTVLVLLDQVGQLAYYQQADPWEMGRGATQSIATVLGGGLAFNAMMGLATIAGTASTGTAIGTLSGAAFNSAALAWWGGGSVAAGGGGMAVGSMVVAGGVFVIGIAIGYGAVKAWDFLDKSERDAMNLMAEKLQSAENLTTSDNPVGASILAEKRRIDELRRQRAISKSIIQQ